MPKHSEPGLLLRMDQLKHLPASATSIDPGVSVAFRDGRAFIPIARSGCGIGCKYCYISAPSAKVQPLLPEYMHILLGDVRDHIYKYYQPVPIIAIGCDTEVGVSPQLVNNALICLEFAARYHLPVQLATKFPLPTALRGALDNWPIPNAPPMVFTTITTVTISARIEPNAPSPAERSANFTAHLPTWQSYALIKPFLQTTGEDREALLELLAANRPDGVVVGVRYRRRRTTDHGDPHPVTSDWIATLPSDSARLFILRLTEMGLRVFMNTQCASSWHNLSLDSTIVRNKYPHLCVQCGRCPEEARVAR